jgi:hypothetical protein
VRSASCGGEGAISFGGGKRYGGIENRVVVSRDARYVAYANLDIVPPDIRTVNL